jgi:NAD(P)-dependent dehydrogenase (short-subunit alcohol dehydrogenase family)
VDLDDPNFERRPYVEFVAYGQSKTANIQFTVEFDARHKGRGVRATAVHPGVIATELSRYLTPEVSAQMATLNQRSGQPAALNFFRKTPAQGAATSVWAGITASADEVGGRYCEDCHVAETVDDQAIRGGVQRYALDPAKAKALWALSEKMVGEAF